MQKEDYMRRALELAEMGMGYTSPNPMVGCVVVKDGRIISEGYHERYGEFHAERNALTRCKEDCTGADLYVTLEPCCHYGKTPPCTEIIIDKKIGRVFIGSMDSNPLVAGRGVQILRKHGIEVETGILEEECLKLNEVFYHFIQTKKPFVVMKYAMTLDGKIACESGDSKWVTGEASRMEVQRMRRRYKGIMVGIGTVIADNPMLNCRIEEGVDPVRIICDSMLRIPMDCNIVRTAKDIQTIVACSSKTFNDSEKRKKKRELEDAGIEVISTQNTKQIDLEELMEILGAKKIDSVLLEGGGTLNSSALQAGIVNKVYAFIAGKLVGGKDAKSPVEGDGIKKMSDAVELENIEILKIKKDICICGYPKKPE